LFKEKCFEFRVKLMEDRASSGEESVAVTCDGGADGCSSCLGKEFQNTGAWWVKGLSVIVRRERTEGRWRVMMTVERVVGLR